MTTANAPVSERVLTILGTMAAIVVAAVGMAMFYTRYAYAEEGHGTLAIVYLAACMGIFFGIRLWKISFLLVCLIVGLGVQLYAYKKFDWRENYITLAQAGQPFFLEEYIDHYPTFEEHAFPFMGAPNWVKFNDECVQPALVNQPIPPRCTTFDLILRHYHVDAHAAMQQYFAKMKNTAAMIQKGELNKRSAYAECIANKSCVTIPLLPKGVDATKIDASSKDYMRVRQAFWSLVNDPTMSPEVCSLNDFCRALVAMKAVDPTKLPF